MKRIVIGLLCALISCTALAGRDAASKRPGASMLVTGWIEINPNGDVRTYLIDDPNKVPPIVLQVIQKTVPAWKFQVDVKPAAITKAQMNLRIVATPIGEKGFSVGVAGVDFGKSDYGTAGELTRKEIKSPRYPYRALESRVTGVVYLLLRVGRDGKVQDVAPEQINLTSNVNESLRGMFRKNLADAALQAAKTWTFNVPTKGDNANFPYWYARTPVQFSINDASSNSPSPSEQYGSWQGYFPGPRLLIPWVQDRASLSAAPDSVPEGALRTLSGSSSSVKLNNG